MQIGAKKLCDEIDVLEGRDEDIAKRDDIFVSEMLEQLQLTVRPLSEHRRAEGLHDLLDGDILVGELVSRRADKTKRSHAHGLEVRVP